MFIRSRDASELGAGSNYSRPALLPAAEQFGDEKTEIT
jgi:hypothetical protein